VDFKKCADFNGFHYCISPELDRKHLERLGFGAMGETGGFLMISVGSPKTRCFWVKTDVLNINPMFY
jgi:hypothetical protein